MKSELLHLDDPERRALVERLAKAAFGLAVLPWLPGTRAWAGPAAVPSARGHGSARAVIMLQLSGGMSHIDTFDPKEGPSKGPRGGLRTKAGFQVTEFLPQTATIADKLCVIRSMTAKVGVHESARYLMRTGYEKRGTVVHPALGPWLQQYLGPSHATLPSSVCVNRSPGHGNGFFPAGTSPLPILDPDEGLQHAQPGGRVGAMDRRLALLHALERNAPGVMADDHAKAYGDFYEGALRLMKGKDLDAFDIGGETEVVRASYGDSKFGRGCLLARRLIERGVRFVEVESGGWDHHRELEDGMQDEGAQFDTAFAALIHDLEARSLLSSTLVVVATEFGRDPRMNGSGRGHYPKAFSCVLAGAGTKRGHVHGATDARGAEPVADPVTVPQLHATIGWAAGVPLDKEVVSPSGRPFTIGNKARPVMEVFA